MRRPTLAVGGLASPPKERFGKWQHYTPIWASDGTPPAIGDGSLNGDYRLLDDTTMEINIWFLRGSGSTNGTGTYTWSLPPGFKAWNGVGQAISARLLDSGTAHLVGIGYIDPNTTAFYAMIGVGAGNAIMQLGVPITLANGDQLNLSGVIRYEVA